MPPKQGYHQINIALPEDVALQLATLATAHDGSKSKVVESVLRTHLEGSLTETVMDKVHQHLSAVSDECQTVLRDMSDHLAQLSTLVHTMAQRVTNLETQQARQYQNLVEAFDRLKSSGHTVSLLPKILRKG